MTTSFQQADTGDQPEGAVTHWEVDWYDIHITFRLQPDKRFGELVLSRGEGTSREVHAAIIPVCSCSINGVAVPPPAVYVDGVRYAPVIEVSEGASTTSR